jgi:DNA-directed RNA polymerase subunit K/omega
MSLAPDEELARTDTDPVAQMLQNRFHVSVLAFQRARQLMQGHRPRVDAPGHTIPRVALLEVMAGAVSWQVT